MHEEVLTKEAKALLPRFRHCKDFYLVGGTALALQIGHRISVDFDFFSEKELPLNFLHGLRRVIPRTTIHMEYQEGREQMTLLIGGIKTTFLHYPYPLLAPLETCEGIPVAALMEIAAMKAFAIGRRLSYKDYVDWYFLLHEEHVTIKEVLTLAKKKFNDDFNDRLFLSQLVSSRDVPLQKIDFLRDAVNRRTVEDFLADAVRGSKL